MPKATIATDCGLAPIKNCYIELPGFGKVVMNNLPDLSDSKSASYSDQSIIGRSFPLKTFSHSENRSINWGLHLFVTKQADIGGNLVPNQESIQGNLAIMRVLESCVYPRDSGTGPYTPPLICKLFCGELLSRQGPICAVLKSYSVKFPSDVAWDEATLTPYKIDIDLSFDVVYSSSDLPGADRIVQFGG